MEEKRGGNSLRSSTEIVRTNRPTNTEKERGGGSNFVVDKYFQPEGVFTRRCGYT